MVYFNYRINLIYCTENKTFQSHHEILCKFRAFSSNLTDYEKIFLKLFDRN